MSDGSGVQFPFRKEIPKSLHQIINVIGLDGFLPENKDERRLTCEPCLYGQSPPPESVHPLQIDAQQMW